MQPFHTWMRGRGWALWKALIVCADLPGTNQVEVDKSWQVINEVLADYKAQSIGLRLN